MKTNKKQDKKADLRREMLHPDGTMLAIGMHRGGYLVRAKNRRGEFYYIGAFGGRGQTVYVDKPEYRIWVEWASKLPPSDLPTTDSDMHWPPPQRDKVANATNIRRRWPHLAHTADLFEGE